MRREEWLELLREATRSLERWEDGWAEWPELGPDAGAEVALSELVARLRNNYPFGHPRYAGQMIKPPHPLAWVAHAVTALVNPNNHALDGGPATAALELEAVAALAAMVGYPSYPGAHLGHLTASGTIANLEALWVAREVTDGRPIAVSAAAHYTHARMAQVLGVEVVPVPADAAGRLDVDALAALLARRSIGTVVATLGTTGLGALDPLDAILPLARAHRARVHVDAAYGGFFSLLARRTPPLVEPAPFAVLGEADSVVVDPHKHGLQAFGAGCVLFRDPSVARVYAHDSPYTYFTSAERHLGEISLECTRSGAAAAALWTTLRAIPLVPEGGLGDGLAAGRRAALGWAAALERSAHLRLLLPPATDILVFAPLGPAERLAASALSARVDAVFAAAMADPTEPVYLAKIRLDPGLVAAHWPEVTGDVAEVTLLRSVVMKPDHERWWPRLHERLERLAALQHGAP
ncbi:MAG TPA: aminotransferase class I/II-fold pyridoxal phosphate-dependent enzyme [Polyangiaceae bacterium]|nr:aminotransferase class I/II-fold pyridoxal phosphate-dependent enzyme [Polyangiaceae bacterium]